MKLVKKYRGGYTSEIELNDKEREKEAAEEVLGEYNEDAVIEDQEIIAELREAYNSEGD